MDPLMQTNIMAKMIIKIENMRKQNQKLQSRCEHLTRLVEIWQFYCLNSQESFCLKCGHSKNKKFRDRLNAESVAYTDEQRKTSAERTSVENSSSESPESQTSPKTRLNNISRKLKRFLSNKSDCNENKIFPKSVREVFGRSKSENSDDEITKKAVLTPSLFLLSPFSKQMLNTQICKQEDTTAEQQKESIVKANDETQKRPSSRKFGSLSVDMPYWKFPVFSRRASCDVVSENVIEAGNPTLTLSAPSSDSKFKISANSDTQKDTLKSFFKPTERPQTPIKTSSFLYTSLSKSLIKSNVLLQFFPDYSPNTCSRCPSSNLSTLHEENTTDDVVTFQHDEYTLSRPSAASNQSISKETDCLSIGKLDLSKKNDDENTLYDDLVDAYSISKIEQFNMALLNNLSRKDSSTLKSTESLQNMASTKPTDDKMKGYTNKSFKATAKQNIESRSKISTDNKKNKTSNASTLSLSLNITDTGKINKEQWTKMNSLLDVSSDFSEKMLKWEKMKKQNATDKTTKNKENKSSSKPSDKLTPNQFSSPSFLQYTRSSPLLHNIKYKPETRPPITPLSAPLNLSLVSKIGITDNENSNNYNNNNNNKMIDNNNNTKQSGCLINELKKQLACEMLIAVTSSNNNYNNNCNNNNYNNNSCNNNCNNNNYNNNCYKNNNYIVASNGNDANELETSEKFKNTSLKGYSNNQFTTTTNSVNNSNNLFNTTTTNVTNTKTGGSSNTHNNITSNNTATTSTKTSNNNCNVSSNNKNNVNSQVEQQYKNPISGAKPVEIVVFLTDEDHNDAVNNLNASSDGGSNNCNLQTSTNPSILNINSNNINNNSNTNNNNVNSSSNNMGSSILDPISRCSSYNSNTAVSPNFNSTNGVGDVHVKVQDSQHDLLSELLMDNRNLDEKLTEKEEEMDLMKKEIINLKEKIKINEYEKSLFETLSDCACCLLHKFVPNNQQSNHQHPCLHHHHDAPYSYSSSSSSSYAMMLLNKLRNALFVVSKQSEVLLKELKIKQEQIMNEVQMKNEFKVDCLKELESMLMPGGVDDGSKQYVIDCLWVVLDCFYNKFLKWRLCTERRGLVIQDLEHHLFAVRVTNQLLKLKLKQKHQTNFNLQHPTLSSKHSIHRHRDGYQGDASEFKEEMMKECCFMEDEHITQDIQDIGVESKVADMDEQFIDRFNDLIKKASESKPSRLKLRRQSALEVISPSSDHPSIKKSFASESEIRCNNEESEDEGCVVKGSVEEELSIKKSSNVIRCQYSVSLNEDVDVNHLVRVQDSEPFESKTDIHANSFKEWDENDVNEVEKFKKDGIGSSSVINSNLLKNIDHVETTAKTINKDSNDIFSNNATDNKIQTNYNPMKTPHNLSTNESHKSPIQPLKDNITEPHQIQNKVKPTSKTISITTKPNKKTSHINRARDLNNNNNNNKASNNGHSTNVTMSVFRPKKQEDDACWVIREAKLPYFEIQIIDEEQVSKVPTINTPTKRTTAGNDNSNLHLSDVKKGGDLFKKIMEGQAMIDGKSMEIDAPLTKNLCDKSKVIDVSNTMGYIDMNNKKDRKIISTEVHKPSSVIKESQVNLDNKDEMSLEISSNCDSKIDKMLVTDIGIKEFFESKNVGSKTSIESKSPSPGSRVSSESVKTNMKKIESKEMEKRREILINKNNTPTNCDANVGMKKKTDASMKFKSEKQQHPQPTNQQQPQHSQQTVQQHQHHLRGHSQIDKQFQPPIQSVISISAYNPPVSKHYDSVSKSTQPTNLNKFEFTDEDNKKLKKDSGVQVKNLKSIFNKASPDKSPSNICKKLCSK